MLAVIHCEPRIAWQGPFAQKMSEGLKRLGVPHEITSDRQRREGLPILLGTTLWRGIEPGGPFLLVDRCNFGDTNHWVSLVRDGHGRRGDHRVTVDPSRWERYAVPIHPWHNGSRVVLCGQHETYSPHYRTPEDWYAGIPATHFRPHPTAGNPTGLPECRTWNGVGQAVTLNSSVAVDAVLHGVPTVTMDEGSMAWGVTGHTPGEIVKPPRIEWLHWLACTQWTHDEIAEGKWAHLL